jgi:hypothetical protein
MSKARDLANAGTALTTVSATELGYLDGVTSNVQTQINNKDSLPSQTGNAGKFLTTNGTDESWASAGVTWTQRTNALTSGRINMITFNGTNLYIAVGTAGLLLTSPDAITWTSRTSGFGSDEILVVYFANSLWVIGGAAGKLATSTDGITWTARTSQFGTNAIYNVKYVNSLWFALGAGGPNGGTNTGGLAYSSDGATWTRATMTGASIGNPTDIEFVGSTYVIGASGYGASNIGYTTNLNSGWANINPENLQANAVRLFWNGSAWIYTSEATDGTALTSTSTPPFTWTSLSPRLTTNDYYATMAGARVSGNTIYSLKDLGNNDTVIMTTPWAITSGRFNTLGQSINAPGAGMYAFRVLCVNASNQFVVADEQGRIYTSF